LSTGTDRWSLGVGLAVSRALKAGLQSQILPCIPVFDVHVMVGCGSGLEMAQTLDPSQLDISWLVD
jgi:hypothetical protein